MELIIESSFTRITGQSEGELCIIILSSPILHAAKERALYRLNGAKQYTITIVSKEIEEEGSDIFLLMFRPCARTQKEMLWVQLLELKSSYLNIPLKLTP